MMFTLFTPNRVIPAKAGISVCRFRGGSKSNGPGVARLVRPRQERSALPTEIPAFAGMTL
jgi:hypothetical protein